MKKLYSLTVIITFWFSSCQEPENDLHQSTEIFLETLYLPDKSMFTEGQEYIPIPIDSFPDYISVYERIVELNCIQGKTPVLKFSQDQIQYLIMVNVDCQDEMIACYSKIKFASLNNGYINEVTSEEKFLIEDLNIFIDKYVDFPYNKRWGAEIMNPVLLYFYMNPEKPTAVLKEILLKTIHGFEDISKSKNMSFPYYFEFREKPFNYPPPPPPPHMQNTIEEL